MIKRLRSGILITHEYLMNYRAQAGPQPCPFCHDAVKNVKYNNNVPWFSPSTKEG